MASNILPNILIIASNQSISSKDLYEVRIVSRDRTKTKRPQELVLLLSLKGNLIMSLFSPSRISLLFGHYDETLPHYNLAYIKLTQGPRDHPQTTLTPKLKIIDKINFRIVFEKQN